MSNYQSIARAAVVEAHGELAVGDFVGVLQEDQNQVLTFLFASKVKGYPDWTIGATLFVDGSNATVSEVFFAPGEQSLVAPKWVPWSERLADYKALQAALEAEAAAAALEALENADELDETDEVEDSEGEADGADSSDAPAESELKASESVDAAAEADPSEESAFADVPEAKEPESETDPSGGLGKGLFKWKKLRSSKKRK